MTRNELIEALEGAVTTILETGNSAQKLYIRVRPNGEVDTQEETSWTCSVEEYYGRVPHTLSLEIHKSSRDYSGLDEEEKAAEAACASDAAVEIIGSWLPKIDAWIEAGNFTHAG